MKILGGHYTDNDQLGIGGNTATGIVVDGLDDNPATLDGPELARNHTRTLDAPSWLWRSVTGLLAYHEKRYLDHCRAYVAADSP